MKSKIGQGALAAAIAAATAAAYAPQAGADGDGKLEGSYQSGDFHNHTTCSDGSTSVQNLTKTSLGFLDWFIHVGHSGANPRDCRLDDYAYDGNNDGQGDYWQNTLPNGQGDIKGDLSTSSSYGCSDEPALGPVPAGRCQNMWRWQSLQEYNYPPIADTRGDQTAFLGLEWVVPAHEHTSASVITDQYELDDAAGMAHFEYCFAVNSNDTSQGGGQGWTCEISKANNDALIARFALDPDQGPADYNATLDPATGININDNGDHVKSTAAIYWMQENHAGKSFAVQAHLERAGAFRPGNNRGYNIEHLRDWNNAGPDIAFGMESQPGHQAGSNRGEYGPSRSSGTVASVGIFTYGGTGCYAGAEASQPGFDFDGTPLTAADFQAGGKYEVVSDRAIPEFVTVCRPGVRTAWDAMLSEGRRFWFFASSDWHNRGSFPPFADATPPFAQGEGTIPTGPSTFDFWPGEYQKNYTYIVNRNPTDPAQDVVDGLRSGNNWTTMGDLITALQFEACVRQGPPGEERSSGRGKFNGKGPKKCATMGETLVIEPGDDVEINLAVTDPNGTNYSPYSFPNPALKQIGISEPLNRPSLRQVDLIAGVVTGPIPATLANGAPNPAYQVQLAPPTTRIVESWTQDDWSRSARKTMSYVLENVTTDAYVRARGSNLPAGTPNQRDANGNPLRDDLADNIPCDDAACPAHVNGVFDNDVEAWGDLAFYANPIFIKVAGEDEKVYRASR